MRFDVLRALRFTRQNTASKIGFGTKTAAFGGEMNLFTSSLRANLFFACVVALGLVGVGNGRLVAQGMSGATAPQMMTPGEGEAIDRPSNNTVAPSEFATTNDAMMGRQGAVPVPPGNAINDDAPQAGIPPSGVPRELQEPTQTEVRPNQGGLSARAAENTGASVPNVNDSSSNQQLMEEETAANPTGPGARSPFSGVAWIPILFIGGVLTVLCLWLMTQFYRNKKRA